MRDCLPRPLALVMSATLGSVALINTALVLKAQQPAAEGPQVVRRSLQAYLGKSPKVDGRLGAGEWADATRFDSRGWVSTFSPVQKPEDLFAVGYVKHDGERLYFGFAVTDDVLYGIDTPRWLPDNNPKAHELTREGWPWFGDEMEILLNGPNRWQGDESAAGTGASWQMVCNLTKSRLGGVGKPGKDGAAAGGLLEGEPRAKAAAWEQYQQWIMNRAMECAVAVKPGGKGYTMEWAIRFNPCVELAPGQFYSPAMGRRTVGLNIALGDLDEKERGKGNFGNFHHEDWWSGTPKGRTQLNQFGELELHPGRRP